MQGITRIIARLWALLSTAACGAPTNPAVEDPDRAEVMLLAEVQSLTQWLLLFRADRGLETAALRAPTFLPRGICELRGDSTDSNMNGIPDDMTITYPGPNCPPDLAFGTSGTIRVQDIGGRWGARVTYDRYVPSHISLPTRSDETIHGVMELHQLSDTTLEVHDRTSAVRTNLPSPGFEISQNSDLRAVFIGAATVSPGGLFQRSPRRVTVEGWTTMAVAGPARDSLRFAYTTLAPLTEPQVTCRSPYSAGRLQIAVSGLSSNTFTRQFSC
jgi:hypothetical protein